LLNGQFSKNKGDKGYITVKGSSNETGMSLEVGKRYLPWKPKNYCYCEKVIDKIGLKSGNHTYEVDEFYGANKA
jgi:adenylate cyclase